MQKQISIVNEKTGSVITTVGADVGPDQVVIRRLGWRRLEEAERARIKSSLQQVRELGGAAAVKEIQAEAETMRGAIEGAAKRDPLLGYDKGTLILIGSASFDGATPTMADVDDLEPESASAIALAVLKLARPGLFETEADAKNG